MPPVVLASLRAPGSLRPVLARPSEHGAATRAVLRAAEGPERGGARGTGAMFMIIHFVNMAVRHKHLKIDQTKLDRAKKLLRVKTEQETVERALDALLDEESILRAHRKVKGVGGFVDVFGRSR